MNLRGNPLTPSPSPPRGRGEPVWIGFQQTHAIGRVQLKSCRLRLIEPTILGPLRTVCKPMADECSEKFSGTHTNLAPLSLFKGEGLGVRVLSMRDVP